MFIGPASVSDEKSTSGSITTRTSFLHGIEVLPPVTGTATVKIYDSEDSNTSGKRAIALVTVADGMNSVYIEFSTPRVANRGIYCVLSGSATTYTVGYSLT